MRPFSFAITRQIEVNLTSKAKFHMSRSRRWRTKNTASRQEARAASAAAKMENKPDYSNWTHESLVERVTQLEKELKDKNQRLVRSTSTPEDFTDRKHSLSPAIPEKKSWKKPHTARDFDPAKYNTRLVAFKLAYLGKRYNGFEYHAGNPTPLPTIEEELWKALNKARLIFPAGSHPLQPGEVNWEGTDYSKCGRTDKGVSAFGQVIGIRVRSNRPLGKNKKKQDVDEAVESPGNVADDYYNLFPKEDGEQDAFNTLPRPGGLELAAPPLGLSEGNVEDIGTEELNIDDPEYQDSLNFDPVKDEIQYCQLLNRLLPPDIRILAWCPSPPIDFSARFSCRERRYKYFFTQPAFSPAPHHLEVEVPGRSPGQVKDGWLDIQAMREAAKAFEGVHDFRNFCKVDGGKQISNFERTIFYSNIEEVEDYTSALAYLNGTDFLPAGSTSSNNPKVYTFTLHGSAFLWHQVRHMVAILFLVGQGLEKPSIVSELLDVEKNPRRPTYEMATDTPLVLWDCIFPREDDPERKDAMQWLYIGDGPQRGDTKYGTPGLMDDLWKLWRERKIDEMLAGTLMGAVASQGSKVSDLERSDGSRASKSQKVFSGDDAPRLQGTYTPVMKKPLMDSVEVINEKYAVRKGFESSEDMKEQGFRRVNKLDADQS